MSSFFKDWLSFSKKERLGILVLLLVIAFLIVIPEIYTSNMEVPPLDSGILRSLQPSTDENAHAISIDRNTSHESITKTAFYFDPNTLDENGWMKLGIDQKIIKTILNYRSNGGLFKSPTDIQKIWGLPAAEANRLIPFIIIPEKRKPNDAIKLKGKSLPKIIDINDATVADWESLPGIGSVLANRILRFKDKLGGFKSLEQVGKTYGISDTVFKSILPFLTLHPVDTNSHMIGSNHQKNAFPTKDSLLDINKATLRQLLQAGIDEGVAKAIVYYRKQYGQFNQLIDLKKIVFINEAVYQQILPKLKIE
jgi:DNA uptake protein ComE-like DNA-binding protein